MLANDMGIDNISAFMAQLGLGSRTGIDIEGESKGVLPSQAWKKKRFKKPEQQKWYAGETISIGIGQGYNAYTSCSWRTPRPSSPTMASCIVRTW
jgi:penicillin-binding protein 2